MRVLIQTEDEERSYQVDTVYIDDNRFPQGKRLVGWLSTEQIFSLPLEDIKCAMVEDIEWAMVQA